MCSRNDYDRVPLAAESLQVADLSGASRRSVKYTQHAAGRARFAAIGHGTIFSDPRLSAEGDGTLAAPVKEGSPQSERQGDTHEDRDFGRLYRRDCLRRLPPRGTGSVL